MKKSELIFILLMFLPTILMAVFGMWVLFCVFFAFDVCFGLIEWYNVKKTGKSVSQQFWAWGKEHKVKAIIILSSMIIMWGALIWHLGSKLFLP